MRFRYSPNPVPLQLEDYHRFLSDELERIRVAIEQTPRWDDLRFPAQGVNPPGSVNDPQVENTTGLLLFRFNQTNVIGGVAQMPHSWKEQSIVRPHIHWQKTTSATGNVYWQIEYEVWNNGDTALMTYANVNFATTPVAGTPDNNTANEILITSLGDIDMTGIQASGLIIWKVSRVGGNPADTYGASSRLLEFDIHYEIDSFGSEQEFVKYA